MSNVANFDFLFLPRYAQYLLDNKLKEYAAALLQASRTVDIPILRYFKGYSDDQLVAMSMERNKELLELLAHSKFSEIIENSTRNWVTNQLPMVQRDQVVAEDIVMVSFTRRKVFRDLLPAYTTDLGQFARVMEEVDRFTLLLDTSLFNTFIQLEQEKINGINLALQKRETELLEAQAIGQIGSFEWDLSGANSRYTPEVFKIFEFEQTSSLPSFMQDVHPDDREKLSAAIAQGLKDGNFDCEYRYSRNNKDKVIWSRGKGYFEGAKMVKMIGTIMDVTERYKFITRLQQSEELHKQAQALTHIGNWSWDIDKDQVNWSDEMYRIYGLKPQSEVITLDRFLNFVHPEDKEKRLEEIKQSLQSLVVAEYHFRIITPQGDVKVLRGRGEIKTDRDKKPITLTGTCQDITREFGMNKALKEKEQHTANLNASLEQKNQELQRTNAELESFNFIASHDLKEPLRKIRMFSDLVMEEASHLPAPTLAYVQKMQVAAGRMQKLIDDFLSFSKTMAQQQAFEPTNLAKLMVEIRHDLAGLIEEKAAVIDAPRLPTIQAIPFQLKQLLSNLINNALKYSKNDVIPRITVTVKTVTGAESGMEEASPKMKYRQISVSDNGIGFDQKYASKIFELFQRLHTKDKYSGTGIGLAICKKIAANHQGFIKAESKEKKGSVFTLYIPFKR